MKKHCNRNNIHKLKLRAKKVKRAEKKTLEALHRPFIEAWVYMKDEDPLRELGQASNVHSNYLEYCREEGLLCCSQTIFGKIMSSYVIKREGPRGCKYYSLNDDIYNYLLSLLDAGERVKKAA